MELNEESVKAHVDLMTRPRDFDLRFRPLKDCFREIEGVTANHVLFEGYHTEVPLCQKTFFYIVMDEVYGPSTGKDEHGNLGRHLEFVEKKGVKKK